MVIAIGRNILPSTPSSVSSGTYTSMMIATANATGRATRLAHVGVRACARAAPTSLLARGRGDHGLEHDDRPVDQEAEVDRAEAHQIAGDAEHVHAEEGDRHRRGDAEHDRRARRAACRATARARP